MACLVENDNNVIVSIPTHETKDNVTFYKIDVTVGAVHWTVSHRYKDFAELHDVLVNDHCIIKELLPQKKLIGNRDPEFVEKRRISLEQYLQNVLSHLRRAMPTVLLKFLDVDKYELSHILRLMAFKFFIEGDGILQKSSEHSFNPLQLHAISERLQKCGVPDEVIYGHFDFSHVLDFCGKLKTMYIRGSRSNWGSSNLVLNNLSFDLTVFKAVRSLYFYNVQLCNIGDLGSLRQTVDTLVIYNSNMRQLADALLCDKLHKTCENDKDKWPKLNNIDFSWNEIKRIDKGLQLVTNVQSLTMDGNQIGSIENTELLPNLTHLCLSVNNIVVEECLHAKLKNIVRLNLSQNKIAKLWPFAKLVHLKDLNLGSNNVSESNEIKFISSLPALEYLVLTGNPVSTIIDYRIKVFEYFGDRAQYLCLDNERASQKELDTAAVFRALTVVREGRSPNLVVSPSN